MIDKRTTLTVFHDDNASFTDYSHKMGAFARDSVTMTITNAEDYIYVGYHKPINAVYVDITTPNGSEGINTVEYWNGTAWANVNGQSDDTLGLFRSGFIRWDKKNGDTANDHVANEVNSVSKYWYRVRPSADRTGITLSGLNLVFSDDYELSLEQPYISDSEFLGSESSHIKTHVAVRKEILQKFNNKDYYVIDEVTGDKEDVTCWDLLDIDEVKLSASYLALSKIYNQLSDNPEDVWAVKSAQYEDKYNKYINIARLSVDVNDNGTKDAVENKPGFKTRYFSR